MWRSVYGEPYSTPCAYTGAEPDRAARQLAGVARPRAVYASSPFSRGSGGSPSAITYHQVAVIKNATTPNATAPFQPETNGASLSGGGRVSDRQELRVQSDRSPNDKPHGQRRANIVPVHRPGIRARRVRRRRRAHDPRLAVRSEGVKIDGLVALVMSWDRSRHREPPAEFLGWLERALVR